MRMTAVFERRVTAGALAVALVLSVFISRAAAETALGTREPAKPVAVLELYSSQGCSLCPPAIDFVNTLANRPDVVVLSLPVDYWDYLGWKDTLAQPQHAERQKAYAEGRGDADVYTPQIILNGAQVFTGADTDAIRAAIDNAMPLPVSVGISRRAGTLDIAIDGPRTGKNAIVYFLSVQPQIFVNITRGENTGREIAYRNVVTDAQTVAAWSGGTNRVQVALPEGEDDRNHIVVVQETVNGRPGHVLGVAIDAPNARGASSGL